MFYKYILMHIYEIQKNGTDEPTCREGMKSQIQRTNMWNSGGMRDWDKWKKQHRHTYTTVCRMGSW